MTDTHTDPATTSTPSPAPEQADAALEAARDLRLQLLKRCTTAIHAPAEAYRALVQSLVDVQGVVERLEDHQGGGELGALARRLLPALVERLLKIGQNPMAVPATKPATRKRARRR